MEQRTAEWFEARKGMITASNVGAIRGHDPYRGPDDVMRAMVREYHGADPEFQGNCATEWGTQMEDTAKAAYTMETGQAIEEAGFLRAHHPAWLGASPDGLVDDDGMTEIKCPYGLRNYDADSLEFKGIGPGIQPHYYDQMQVQMFVAGRQWCDFFQWAPAGTCLVRVYHDEAWIRDIIEDCSAFYDRYLTEREKPEKYGVVSDGDLAALEAEYRELAETLEHAKARQTELLALIRAAMEDQPGKLPGGASLVRRQNKGSISYAQAVKDLMPDADLEPYRGKPSESWSIKV